MTFSRQTLLASLLGASLLGACASTSGMRGLDADFASTVQGPVKVEVMLSESLQQRAEGLPDDLTLRSGTRSVSAGFAANGYYGTEELQELLDDTREELVADLTKYGVGYSDSAPTVLRVTLEDVRNNRPTFNQLSRQPNLDFDSYGAGGAELSAELVDGAGVTLGTLEYRWYDSLQGNDLDQATSVWRDTQRAISRFSKASAKAIRDSRRS